MKLTELIKNAEWLSVETVFLKLYPDENKNLLGYEEVFNKLKIMEPNLDKPKPKRVLACPSWSAKFTMHIIKT